MPLRSRGAPCVVCDRTTFRETVEGGWPQLFGREIPVCAEHIDAQLNADEVAAVIGKVFS